MVVVMAIAVTQEMMVARMEIQTQTEPEEQVAEFTREIPDIGQTRWSGAAGNHHRRYAFLTRR